VRANCTDDHPQWHLVCRTLKAGVLKTIAAKVFPKRTAEIHDFEREPWFSSN
jgi:hypothetical protein